MASPSDHVALDALAPGRQQTAWLIALIALAAVVIFTRLGTAPITEKSEDRCYEVTRGMYAGHGLLVPYMDGAPRLNKPPLYYWLAFATAKVAGAMNFFSLRVPAALSALCLLAVTSWWARRVLGERAGLLAALLLALMLQFYTLGRRGVAEMPLALFCTLSFIAFDAAFFQHDRAALRWFALWVVLGFMTKATAALLLTALPIVVVLLVHRSLRRVCQWRILSWLGAALLLGLSWYVAILLTVPGAFDALYSAAVLPVGVETHVAAARHYRPVWFYLSEIFIAAAPASLLIPLVIWRAIGSRYFAADPRRRFIAIAFTTMFVSLSILPQKQKHYLISLLPPLAVLIADAVMYWYATRPRAFDVFLRVLGALALALGGVAASITLLFLHVVKGASLAWVVPMALAALLVFVIAATRARAQHTQSFLRWFALGVFCVLPLHYGGVDPWRRDVEAASRVPDDQATAAGRSSLAEWRQLEEQHPLVARLFNVRVHSAAARAPSPQQFRADDGDDDGN